MAFVYYKEESRKPALIDESLVVDKMLHCYLVIFFIWVLWRIQTGRWHLSTFGAVVVLVSFLYITASQIIASTRDRTTVSQES
jgi:hypothetical protein